MSSHAAPAAGKPLSSAARKSWTYIDGKWRDDNPALMRASTHAAWLGSVVFDGARAFSGVAPDLDMHCRRAIRSAISLGLKPMLSASEVEALCWEGIRRFPAGAELYVRPMFYAEEGFVAPDPASTVFALVLTDSPLPPPNGFSACVSRFRRPTPDSAPTDAKASCLYPNAGRALFEAKEKGFDNAIVLDANGNVAEYATSNLWIAKDGVAATPIANGTFLNGITRQRVVKLLRQAGVQTEERTVTVKDVMEADEVFSTGNYAKVTPVTRVENRHLQPGPVFKRARELYWEYARAGKKA
ncbi:MAG: branched-chain amino acid aminotransferase [Alphaproteobacteria bacterium]|nr:branched-chain amino acid aminotransferase [Alphaproteobacteria bacterium]